MLDVKIQEREREMSKKGDIAGVYGEVSNGPVGFFFRKIKMDAKEIQKRCRVLRVTRKKPFADV